MDFGKRKYCHGEYGLGERKVFLVRNLLLRSYFHKGIHVRNFPCVKFAAWIVDIDDFITDNWNVNCGNFNL